MITFLLLFVPGFLGFGYLVAALLCRIDGHSRTDEVRHKSPTSRTESHSSSPSNRHEAPSEFERAPSEDIRHALVY